MSDTESKSWEDVQAAQELLDANGCAHWKVGHVNGTAADALAHFTAQRIISGGVAFQVIHREARTLLALCEEADARFDKHPHQPVQISVGIRDTHN